jgi:integrase
MPRHYLERRVARDGTVSYRCRYEALAPDGTPRLCSETVRQRPGESERALRARAGQRLAELVADAGRGLIAAPSALTVAGLLDRYLDARAGDLAPASLHAYRDVVRILPPALLDARADRVTGLEIEAALGLLRQRGYTARVRMARALLSGAFRAAVRWGIRPTSPLAGGSPTPRPRPPRVWTVEEAGRFLAVADQDELAALWRLLLVAGLRIGEALALAWRDVDLAAGTVTVRRTVTRSASGARAVGERAKRPRSHRTVALGPETVAALAARRARAASVLVFPGRRGPLVYGAVRQRLRRLCHEARVPALTVHGLRHTSATLDLAAGTPPQVVAARLGISVTVLLGTYAHVLPGAQQAAAMALETMLSQDTRQNLGKSG